ncbi:hypothetical protein PENTCL1PPCAC_25745, partial [Pristionchus entomophagus]
TTGNEVLDIMFSLETAYFSLLESLRAEEQMLVYRVRYDLAINAFYNDEVNKVAILAPFLYPAITDKSTIDKPYNLFFFIGHEVFHSVVRTDWAEKSPAFNSGMKCMIDHYNKTCDTYPVGSCNSGAQTFEEDGPDIEGQRINYEFLIRNNKEEELNEIVFESERLSVNREQAFFYLSGITFCSEIKAIDNHTDVHSLPHARINGLVTQMPEFTKAFFCSSNQAMYTEK